MRMHLAQNDHALRKACGLMTNCQFFFLYIYVGYGRTGSDPAVHSTSSVKTYNLKWYQRDQQRRHSTKNREAKGTPPSHCSTEQLIQNSSKVNKKKTFTIHTHTTHTFKKVSFEMKFVVLLLLLLSKIQLSSSYSHACILYNSIHLINVLFS